MGDLEEKLIANRTIEDGVLLSDVKKKSVRKKKSQKKKSSVKYLPTDKMEISLWIPVTLNERISAFMVGSGASRSAIIRLALVEYLNKQII